MKKVVVSLVSAAALATITAGMAAPTKSTVASSDNQSFFAGKDAGVYVSGNIGYGYVNNKNILPRKNRHGFAYSADLGYQFNPYLALELGYLHVNSFKVANTHFSTAAIDLVAKGIYPINEQFNVFGKAGVARMEDDSSTTSNNVTVKTTYHKYVPVIGAGVSYNVNDNVSVSLQDVYTFESGKFTVAGASTRMAATNSVLVGATYKFSDLV